MTISFLFSLLALFAVVKRAIAYPNMAGGCDGGVAAVGPPHLIPGAVNGSLADGNYSLVINNNVIDPKLSSITFVSGKSYHISIRIAVGSSATFRGALIRAEMGAAGGFTLDPETNGQAASVCLVPIRGVCHTSNADKTELGAKFKTSSTGTLFLDVTVVKSNNAVDGSRYYYTRFTFLGVTTINPAASFVPLVHVSSPPSRGGGRTTAPMTGTPIVPAPTTVPVATVHSAPSPSAAAAAGNSTTPTMAPSLFASSSGTNTTTVVAPVAGALGSTSPSPPGRMSNNASSAPNAKTSPTAVPSPMVTPLPNLTAAPTNGHSTATSNSTALGNLTAVNVTVGNLTANSNNTNSSQTYTPTTMPAPSPPTVTAPTAVKPPPTPKTTSAADHAKQAWSVVWVVGTAVTAAFVW